MRSLAALVVLLLGGSASAADPSTSRAPPAEAAFGVSAHTDVATIGSNELLTNGHFTGGASGWHLTGFSHGGNAISHAAGSIGTATQTLSMKAYRQYRLSVTLTTTSKVGFGLPLTSAIAFFFDGVSLLDTDFKYYPLDAGGPTTYVFNVEFRSATATGTFSVTTDTSWAGSIHAVSLIEVQDELPFVFAGVSSDDPTGRNPHGLKLGRFNAGQYFLGDRQTGAFHQSDGTWNVAIGARALSTNEHGFENTALGAFALKYNLSPRNVAVGYSAAKLNTVGINLTALGYKAAAWNTVGNQNTAVGFHASFQNVSGNQNTSVGYQALYSALTDSYNTGVGSQAGYSVRGGIANTYVGALAGFLNRGAESYAFSHDTGIGAEAQIWGENGTAVGARARVGRSDAHASDGTAVGKGAVASATNSTAIGANATIDRGNAVQLGDAAVTVLRIGTHSITWTAGEAPASGTWVRGDVAWNASAAVGQPRGWMCTAGGTPGTWVSMGPL